MESSDDDACPSFSMDTLLSPSGYKWDFLFPDDVESDLDKKRSALSSIINITLVCLRSVCVLFSSTTATSHIDIVV